jgi:hypothetical protein
MSLLMFQTFLTTETLNQFASQAPVVTCSVKPIAKAEKWTKKIPWWSRTTDPSSSSINNNNPLQQQQLKDTSAIPGTTTITDILGTSPKPSQSISLPSSPIQKRVKKTMKTLRPSSEELVNIKYIYILMFYI